MKLLSVQKLLSVRNFYQYETFIDGTFIGTKLLNFFLSVQWLLNFYRYDGRPHGARSPRRRSVRNFYRYETFIGTKLLSVRNFYCSLYRHETFIGMKLLSVKNFLDF